MPTDIEIARSVTPRPITEVAAELGIEADRLLPYGRDKAKILPKQGQSRRGKLVLVSAITPTPAGEGKTTTSVGLAQGLGKIGIRGCVVLREPSLGPCLGMKGGAAGGGRAQVIPMEDINLHFTGDFHAISSAHNLLAAALDNHLHFGNALGLEPRSVLFKRVMDMNDRALRKILVGLGGKTMGVPRETGFDITAASEIMAILCLAEDFADLKARLDRILLGQTIKGGQGVFAADLGVTGAMAMLLKEAVRPNLVQTLEGTPAILHGGPFANIAQGTNSVIATKTALAHADVVVTEAGFGADLGAEKFLDIKCQSAGLAPDAIVIVATVRALKLHGGGDPKRLAEPDPGAVERGLPNLARHLSNMEKFGLRPVVAINCFGTDSVEELAVIRRYAEDRGLKVAESRAHAEGGGGATELARAVMASLEETLGEGGSRFKPLYAWEEPVETKIERVAKEIYGAQAVLYDKDAKRDLARIKKLGLEGLPICIAKTHSSFTDDPKAGGLPQPFELNVREIEIASGAGFLVPITGELLRMPGLPRVPGATRMGVDEDGNIFGLS